MKKIALHCLVLLINVIFINETLGQNRINIKTFNQNNFECNKVFDETYHLWWFKNRWVPNVNDTLPYFVDDRNYKGVVNYGVTFRARDYRNFTFLESNYMYFLKVEFTKCDYNPKDSIIKIEGFVIGGWNTIGRKSKIQNHIDVFLGEKKDTITNCYLGNACYDKIISKETVESKLNNKEIDEFTILDKFHSFYFKNYSYYRTAPEGKRPFKISGKIEKNTLLAFGGRGCYSEIFDLGSMIYTPEKNRQKKISKKEIIVSKPIIIDNKLASDIEKEKVKKVEINYYTYTQNAENYIVTRQYAKAKEQYSLLNQKYSVLFARDINNAIRCAILSRDIKTAFIWSEKLALKGIELPYFNSKIFTSMRNNPQWKNFSVKYDSICKMTKSNFNIKLKQELTDLLTEDQADYGLENRKEPQVLYETTERVTDKLIDLLKREGYPSENKIGVYVERDTILISSPDYNVLIRHAIQRKSKKLNALNELLAKSSETLEYDSERNSSNVTSYNSCYHIYKGNLYCSKSCEKNEATVKKIIFKFNNPYGFIMDYGNFIVMEYNPINPKERDEYYAQNFDFIVKLTDDWKFYEK